MSQNILPGSLLMHKRGKYVYLVLRVDERPEEATVPLHIPFQTPMAFVVEPCGRHTRRFLTEAFLSAYDVVEAV